MIVDCHGHYTTAPGALWDWRKLQVSGKAPGELKISMTRSANRSKARS